MGGVTHWYTLEGGLIFQEEAPRPCVSGVGLPTTTVSKSQSGRITCVRTRVSAIVGIGRDGVSPVNDLRRDGDWDCHARNDGHIIEVDAGGIQIEFRESVWTSGATSMGVTVGGRLLTGRSYA